jgi:putative ABC transport system ATP-binding protein
MIKVTNLKKNFYENEIETKVLKGIDFDVKAGEFIAIMGRSGAGKSTFLYQMSLLDTPTSGEIFIDGIDTHNLKEEEKIDFRLKELGYVFQDYALLPDLTAIENVALPLLMQGFDKKRAYDQSAETLIKMGLESRMNAVPGHLSGGEQQRVSISRSIVHKPKILFADEPTANLDNVSSTKVMEIFKELHSQGQTIVMVTHEDEYGKRAEKIVKIDDGLIIDEIIN